MRRKGDAAAARTQPDHREMQVVLLASSLDTAFWPLVPSPAGSQRAKGSCLDPGFVRAEQERQVAMPGASPTRGHGWSACSLRALKCCPLVLCTIPCFQGSVPDSGLGSCPAEGHHAVVMAFRSFISPSRWAISLVSSSGS